MSKRILNIAGIYVTVVGFWKNLFQLATGAIHKTKARKSRNLIGLPGSKWVFGSSVGAAGEIASYYDRTENPDIKTDLARDGILPLEKGIEGSTNLESSDNDWIRYESHDHDPYT